MLKKFCIGGQVCWMHGSRKSYKRNIAERAGERGLAAFDQMRRVTELLLRTGRSSSEHH